MRNGKKSFVPRCIVSYLEKGRRQLLGRHLMVSDVSEKHERWGPWWGCHHSNFLSKNDDLRLLGIQMTSPLSFQQFVKCVCTCGNSLPCLLAFVHLVAMVGSPQCLRPDGQVRLVPSWVCISQGWCDRHVLVRRLWVQDFKGSGRNDVTAEAPKRVCDISECPGVTGEEVEPTLYRF